VRVERCQQITSGLAKLGGKVITRTAARRLTGSDNLNGVQSIPFAKALEASRRQRSRQRLVNTKIKNKDVEYESE